MSTLLTRETTNSCNQGSELVYICKWPRHLTPSRSCVYSSYSRHVPQTRETRNRLVQGRAQTRGTRNRLVQGRAHSWLKHTAQRNHTHSSGMEILQCHTYWCMWSFTVFFATGSLSLLTVSSYIFVVVCTMSLLYSATVLLYMLSIYIDWLISLFNNIID